MIAVAVTMRPPAPKPWTARNAIRPVMVSVQPHRKLPTMKRATLIRNAGLRPKRSPNLPIRAVMIVSASR